MQGAVYICGDNNIDQCTAAVENIAFAQETHAVHVINADVTGKVQVEIFVRSFWDLIN